MAKHDEVVKQILAMVKQAGAQPAPRPPVNLGEIEKIAESLDYVADHLHDLVTDAPELIMAKANSIMKMAEAEEKKETKEHEKKEKKLPPFARKAEEKKEDKEVEKKAAANPKAVGKAIVQMAMAKVASSQKSVLEQKADEAAKHPNVGVTFKAETPGTSETDKRIEQQMKTAALVLKKLANQTNSPPPKKDANAAPKDVAKQVDFPEKATAAKALAASVKREELRKMLGGTLPPSSPMYPKSLDAAFDAKYKPAGTKSYPAEIKTASGENGGPSLADMTESDIIAMFMQDKEASHA